MRKTIFLLLLMTLLCVMTHAQASEKLNIYINKDALLSHDISRADIRIRPEGLVKVLRHSLWAWDENNNAFSMFVEVQNISDENIAIHEDWLYSCKSNREDIAVADYALDFTNNVIHPGERVVIHAGVDVWHAPTDYHDVSDFEDVFGLSTFARPIRQAKLIRLRFELCNNPARHKQYPVDVDAHAWIENGKLYFQTTNATPNTVGYYRIGIVVSDKDGRIIDVLSTSLAKEGIIPSGETLLIEKELQPYITESMIDGATFEVFAYSDEMIVFER